MPAEVAVEVTLSNPLSAQDAASLGLPAAPVGPGASITVGLTAALRLVTSGMTTINPSDKTAIEALFSDPTFVLRTTGESNVYIGPELPTDATAPYVWYQTGLAPAGTGVTMWIEDGS